MARSDQYIYDPPSNRWRPVTAADYGLGGGASDATAANQAIAIASLQSLDFDNATEAQQVAISNAISSLENAWLAENATEAKQDAIIAALVSLEAAIAANSATSTATIGQPLIKDEVNSTASPMSFTVAPGAWSVGFWLIEGSCTVNGYNCHLNNTFGFDHIPGVIYPAFNCVLGAASRIQVIELRP